MIDMYDLCSCELSCSSGCYLLSTNLAHISQWDKATQRTIPHIGSEHHSLFELEKDHCVDRNVFHQQIKSIILEFWCAGPTLSLCNS